MLNEEAGYFTPMCPPLDLQNIHSYSDWKKKNLSQKLLWISLYVALKPGSDSV